MRVLHAMTGGSLPGTVVVLGGTSASRDWPRSFRRTRILPDASARGAATSQRYSNLQSCKLLQACTAASPRLNVSVVMSSTENFEGGFGGGGGVEGGVVFSDMMAGGCD